MGVYIKGFPLPNNCGACPLRLAWCRERIYMVTRPERCPLVPVQPHGRLIDVDALDIYRREEQAWHDYEVFPEEYLEGVKDGFHEAAKCLSTAPTILDAEEGE